PSVSRPLRAPQRYPERSPQRGTKKRKRSGTKDVQSSASDRDSGISCRENARSQRVLAPFAPPCGRFLRLGLLAAHLRERLPWAHAFASARSRSTSVGCE